MTRLLAALLLATPAMAGERVRPVRNANPINRVQRARRDRQG